jgi:hypothetical protein
LSNGLHPCLGLVIEVLRLNSLIKIDHPLTVILLLIRHPLVDGIARGVVLDQLIIKLMALNNIRHLVYKFSIIFPGHQIPYLTELLHREILLLNRGHWCSKARMRRRRLLIIEPDLRRRSM